MRKDDKQSERGNMNEHQLSSSCTDRLICRTHAATVDPNIGFGGWAGGWRVDPTLSIKAVEIFDR